MTNPSHRRSIWILLRLLLLLLRPLLLLLLLRHGLWPLMSRVGARAVGGKISGGKCSAIVRVSARWKSHCSELRNQRSYRKNVE